MEEAAASRSPSPEPPPHGAAASAGANPDLFYRLKLKLWNRDPVTDAIRTPYGSCTAAEGDVAHWAMGTRIVITEEGDTHTGKHGRLDEYRGKGWYAVKLEDGHKATFNPMQWVRSSDQSGKHNPPHATRPSIEAYRMAHRAMEAADGAGKSARDSGTNSPSARGSIAPETPAHAASLTNPPPGTRVRIIRTYGGQLLPRDEVRTGETQTFAHGWYYIALDDSGKKESCRRNSFVVVGDDEDIELGFCEGSGADSVRPNSGRKGGHDTPTDVDGGGDREAVRTYTGKKRGRKPKERVEESDSDDDDGDEVCAEARKEKRRKEKEEEARIKREKDEARRRREEEAAEREREKEREKERKREQLRKEEEEREANMTQEERDALEAARLAAMLNRNPRRRGGDAPPPQMLPRFPKKKKEKPDEGK